MGLPSPDMKYGDACDALRSGGVPVAPEDKVLDTIARAAICLTDAGFPLLAQDAAWMLGMRDGGDVIGAVAMSCVWSRRTFENVARRTPGGVCWAV